VAEALATQSSAKMGGVNPTQAMKAHAIAVPKIVKEVMDKVSMEAIEAVAVTNRPGLKGSLIIGRNYAQYLCYKFKKRK
jgi:N6-L-threonylcarbamoyladenine synthase